MLLLEATHVDSEAELAVELGTSRDGESPKMGSLDFPSPAIAGANDPPALEPPVRRQAADVR